MSDYSQAYEKILYVEKSECKTPPFILLPKRKKQDHLIII